jgi:hypothetical protein
MKLKELNRKVLRRADAGVDSVTVNGQPPGGVSGPIDIISPMASFVAPNDIHIDNANEIAFPTDALTAPDTEINTGFVYTLGGAGPFVIPAPVAPTSAKAPGRKITITLVFPNGVAGVQPITFAGGANGYQFANVAGVGPFLADFTALVAACPAGTNSVIKVGFEYTPQGLTSPWVAVAMAGYYT